MSPKKAIAQKENGLKEIKDEVLNCKKCPLYKSKGLPVVGEGNHNAKIFFTGEAPGKEEAKTGRPFVGSAGKILDQLLASVNIKREEVYITSILKHRPPDNRDPKEEEIQVCFPYLKRQIALIKPKIVCSLGRYALNTLFGEYGLEGKIKPISQIHGQIFQNKISVPKVIIPFYHPAVVAYNPNMREMLQKDFNILKNKTRNEKAHFF